MYLHVSIYVNIRYICTCCSMVASSQKDGRNYGSHTYVFRCPVGGPFGSEMGSRHRGSEQRAKKVVLSTYLRRSLGPLKEERQPCEARKAPGRRPEKHRQLFR